MDNLNLEQTFNTKDQFITKTAWQITEEKFGYDPKYYDRKGFFTGKALKFYKEKHKEIKSISFFWNNDNFKGL
jgi:hypothetical protein